MPREIKVSQFCCDEEVKVCKDQHPQEGNIGIIIESLATKNWDCVHLVAFPGPEFAMFEEHDLQKVK